MKAAVHSQTTIREKQAAINRDEQKSLLLQNQSFPRTEHARSTIQFARGFSSY
jgi:hypothetical protein